MGDRYYLNVLCPNCGHFEESVYYAPTSGIKEHKCPKCGSVVDLEKYSGITEEEASNRGILAGVIDSIQAAIYSARGTTIEDCAKCIEAYAVSLELQQHVGLPGPIEALLEAAKKIREMT